MVSTHTLPENVPEAQFVRSRFVPTLVYVRETETFHTRLCVFNYFSELFPEVTSGASVAIWFFNQQGETVAQRDLMLPYRGQLQFDLSSLGVRFEGTAGLSMVPETLPEFKPAGVGTGYYVFYHDNEGHADFSHEWDPMRFTERRSPPWLCVVRPLAFPETQLIVMNSYYGTDAGIGTTRWVARLRDGQGRVLAEREMDPIPPRGSRRIRVDEIFPNIAEFAARSGTVAIEAVGTNMQGPFTWVTVPGGDFNIHHFC